MPSQLIESVSAARPTPDALSLAIQSNSPIYISRRLAASQQPGSPEFEVDWQEQAPPRPRRQVGRCSCGSRGAWQEQHSQHREVLLTQVCDWPGCHLARLAQDSPLAPLVQDPNYSNRA